MRKSTKTAIIIWGLLGLSQSIWLIGLVAPIDYLSKMVLPTVQTSETWIEILAVSLSLIVGIAGLLGIVIALLAPSKVKSLDFRSPNGKLSVSQRAVEKMVQEAILTEKSVTDVKTNLKMTGRKPKVRVKVSAVDRKDQDLVKLGEEIQTTVINEIGRIMAVPVKKVKVKIKPASSIKSSRTNQPRVV